MYETHQLLALLYVYTYYTECLLYILYFNNLRLIWLCNMYYIINELTEVIIRVFSTNKS